MPRLKVISPGSNAARMPRWSVGLTGGECEFECEASFEGSISQFGV